MYYTSLEYYIRLFESKELEYAFKATSPAEHAKWKRDLRERLREISGINRCVSCEPESPCESKSSCQSEPQFEPESPCGPKHEFLHTEDIEGLTAEYHTLETEPGIVMPFYLLRPEGCQGTGGERPSPEPAGGQRPVPEGMGGRKNLPILIIPHGHGGAKREAIIWQKDFIREALEDGFVVICPDERGSGDRREYPEQGEEEAKRRSNSHRELLQVGIAFGRTVVGTAVWDLMRLADWALALPETGEFLACAGMSGGGQQTLWFGALDERVKAVITSGYFYGVKESLIELPQNCACNFVPHFFETADMGELGALIAPRYLFVESGEQDPLNGKSGIANVKSQINTAKKAFALFHAEKNLVHSIHPGGHQWVGKGMREFLREAVAASAKK